MRREASAPATRLGTYPVSATASRTRAMVAADTLAGSLSARETVICETPARRATAAMVGARGGAGAAVRRGRRHASPGASAPARWRMARTTEKPIERAIKAQSTSAIGLLVKKMVSVPKDSSALTK